MVKPWLPLLCLTLAGCEDDLVDSTQVSSLQVVSMVAEPKQVRPHEQTRLTVTMADPRGEGADVAVWMCTPIGDGRTCLEAEAVTNAQPVSVGTRDPDTHAADFDVVPLPIDVAEIEDALDENTVFRGVLAFALACTPGLCPLFDDIEAGTVDPAMLADPDLLLRDLPMDGVSLAWRAMTITSANERNRETNPTIAPRFSPPVQAAPGASVDLQFDVDGVFSDGLVYPLTTLWGFQTAYTETGPAVPTLRWVAPDSEGRATGHIYAVIDDGQGGQAVWFGPAEVQ